MIFNKQLIKHDPANGVYGDCQRTAIACLLDKLPEDVPNFGVHFMDAEKFDAAMNDYLSSQGLAQFTVAYDGSVGIKAVLDAIGQMNGRHYYMLSGQSERGVNHVVVCRGNKIIHDPHPSSAGLNAPCDNGYFYVCVLVPTSMSDPRTPLSNRGTKP